MDSTERAQARLTLYRTIFSEGLGRQILLDLIQENGLFNSTGAVDLDPQTLAYMKGRLDVVRDIIAKSQLTIEELTEMYEHD